MSSMDRQEIIHNRIVSDMSEGVVTIRFDGIVEFANEAALQILEKNTSELVGASFAQAFVAEEKNDDFVQCVLDTIYEKNKPQERFVSYAGKTVKQLRIVSSYLRDEDAVVGVVLVISDITELNEMRDAVQAMEKIQELNRQLEMRNRVLQETFGRYVSDDVVREILKEPEGWKLGGQRKTLSILMSDLRGFTALSERMPPQELLTMLNHYFSEMYDEIECYHGTLIEIVGDGMLVIFGAPVLSETHAADAVAAAIAMQKRMDDVNRWNAEQGYEPLSMGIAVNTDEVILGNIGSERRAKYGVLGSAVNLVGRIESYTIGGQVLISPGTRDAVAAELKIRRTVRAMPKGVKEEILLSDVVGIGEPYGLQIDWAEGKVQKLPAPAPVSFSLLVKKFVEGNHVQGRILAASESEALLETEEKMALYDNLCIDIGGKLYAKVTGTERDGFRITFTAKPPCFASWFCGICLGSGVKTEGE